MPTKFIAVCGPPGSGKTTYVRKHLLPDEIVIDLDSIRHALTNEPIHEGNAHVGFMVEVKNSIIQEAKRWNIATWVIFSTEGATEAERGKLIREGFQIELMNSSKRLCKERVKGRQRESELLSVIEGWFERADYP